MPSSLLWVYKPERLFVPFPVPTKARKFGPGVVRRTLSGLSKLRVSEAVLSLQDGVCLVIRSASS